MTVWEEKVKRRVLTVVGQHGKAGLRTAPAPDATTVPEFSKLFEKRPYIAAACFSAMSPITGNLNIWF
jgi:hypothetical protein